MWISRSKYNELKNMANYYEVLSDNKRRYEKLFRDRLYECENRLYECEEELKKYKQKYADEIQKRLQLAELVNNLDSTGE